MEKRIIITISRQYGSGGRLIGRKLAEQLEIPFLDRQLITDAASQCGLDEDAVERLEEKTTSSLLYALSGGYATAAMVGDRVDMLPMNDRVFYVQSNLIRKAAREGSCVIVGRCADYILRNNPDAVHVLSLIHILMLGKGSDKIFYSSCITFCGSLQSGRIGTIDAG